MTTETVSTRSVLRVHRVFDNGGVMLVDEDGDYIKLPAARVRHIANLTEGDEVEMRLVLSDRRSNQTIEERMDAIWENDVD